MNTPLLNVMSTAAIKAGKGLLRDFGEVTELQVSKKGPSNFVTKSDIRTEKLLVRELKSARPEFGFLLEEGGEIPGNGPYRWIIDPLDGTTNFIHAIPYFCVSIALEKRENGKSDIMAGVIYDPIHNDLFMAEKGKGATLNNRRMAVSTRDNLENAMLVTGNHRFSPEADRHAAFALFDAVSQCGAAVRFFGATALDLAYLAAGRTDACLYYSAKPWDLAAGLLLVREASGLASEAGGAPAHC